ncbi:hypothetical protein PIB30_022768 [Stylosanthes scabra]|uniref:Rx N-terminal domain-containing protein n=1 Tax=Stylosanthes scabra TaxID=79078 RepID=A0ABU6S9E8_9FABA|nr:hypothetical protein [Stylosanthes scabra]
MRQKAGEPSDGLSTVRPSLTCAPDFLRLRMNFSDGFFILTTSEPSVTSASVSRRYWPSLLERKLDYVDDIYKDVEARIEEAESAGDMQRTNEVKRWLKDVQELQLQV